MLNNKLTEILNDYIRKIKEYIYKFKSIDKIKKYIVIAGIFVILSIVVINKYLSFAYFYDTSSMSIASFRVGNMYSDKYDYVLEIFIENGMNKADGNKSYDLVSSIPTNGYIYSNYQCENGSILEYNDYSKITTAIITEKDVCSIYFDKKDN